MNTIQVSGILASTLSQSVSKLILSDPALSKTSFPRTCCSLPSFCLSRNGSGFEVRPSSVEDTVHDFQVQGMKYTRSFKKSPLRTSLLHCRRSPPSPSAAAAAVIVKT